MAHEALLDPAFAPCLGPDIDGEADVIFTRNMHAFMLRPRSRRGGHGLRRNDSI